MHGWTMCRRLVEVDAFYRIYASLKASTDKAIEEGPKWAEVKKKPAAPAPTLETIFQKSTAASSSDPLPLPKAPGQHVAAAGSSGDVPAGDVSQGALGKPTYRGFGGGVATERYGLVPVSDSWDSREPARVEPLGCLGLL